MMNKTEQDWRGLMLDYSWKWFKYQAEQRFQLLRFYILLSGGIVTGLIAALNNSRLVAAASLAVAGAFFSFIFLQLDSRSKYLIDLGAQALAELEEEIALESQKNLPAMAGRIGSQPGIYFTSTSKALGLMFLILFLGFASLAVFLAWLVSKT